ncbi:hypothetical protein [Pedobacter borealis]|uniref:hypothetical protein n=1 Tax=Pedobacter borealis TaxID=475254 RepID=UPI00049338B5|nr:hypothetical protein [Pedobacter borealis]
MASLSNKKIVPKGVRLGWASLKDAKFAKVTISLASIKGVKVKKSKAVAAHTAVTGRFVTKENYLIP